MYAYHTYVDIVLSLSWIRHSPPLQYCFFNSLSFGIQGVICSYYFSLASGPVKRGSTWNEGASGSAATPNPSSDTGMFILFLQHGLWCALAKLCIYYHLSCSAIRKILTVDRTIVFYKLVENWLDWWRIDLVHKKL